MKRRILFIPVSTGLGHIMRSLAMGNRLKKDNFEIAFAVKKENAEFITKAGYEKVFPLFEQEDKPTFFEKLEAFTQNDYIEKCIKEEIAVYNSFNPDLIVNDGRYSVGISSRIADIKLISVILAIQTQTGIKARAGAITEFAFLHKEAFESWLKMILPPNCEADITKISFKTFMIAAEKYALNINNILDKYKLPHIKSTYELLQSSQMNFIPSVPSFCLLPDLPDNYHYIGPQPSKKNRYCCDNIEHKRLESYGIIINEDDPVLFINFGGMAGVVKDRAVTIIDNIIRQFQNSKYQIVIANKYFKMKSKINNVQIIPFIPSALVMNLKNVLLISHGGLGSLLENISYGNRSVLFPCSMEQLNNSLRVKELSMGELILPNNYTENSIGKIIELLFNDQSLGGINSIKTEIDQYDGAQVAIDLINKLI